MNLSNQPKNLSLLVFGCLVIGIMAALTLSAVILMPFADSIQTKGFDMLALPRGKLISLQVLQMIGFFILPPVLFALFSKNDFVDCFNLNKAFQTKKYLTASLLALLLFPVLINFQYWVMEAPLPEYIRTLADGQKAINEKLIGIFLNQPGIDNLFLMILMIGIGAGLTEELFFRGLIMPWVEKLTNNTWIAIVLSAGIFSLFHTNFYDFLPILFVGILFGYIYSKTRDLKLNIFIHALYNSAQVVLNYMHENKMIATNLDEIKSVPILIWVVCFILVLFLIYKLVEDYEHLPHSS